MIDIRYDKLKKLLNMLDSHQMRRSLRFLQEQNKTNITPFLILQQHLSESQQQTLTTLHRPVILNRVRNKHVLQLFRVET